MARKLNPRVRVCADGTEPSDYQKALISMAKSIRLLI